MSKKLSCIITGKSITVNDDYYLKKVSEFDSEDDFNNHYVSRQAKNLLKRGYKIKEIRDLLKVTKELSAVTEDQIKKILHISDDDFQSLDNLSVKKSDPDVEQFVEHLKNQKSSI